MLFPMGAVETTLEMIRRHVREGVVHVLRQKDRRGDVVGSCSERLGGELAGDCIVACHRALRVHADWRYWPSRGRSTGAGRRLLVEGGQRCMFEPGDLASPGHG